MPRIYRDAFTYHVGNETADVDDLRCHFPSGRLMPLIRKLDPPLQTSELCDIYIDIMHLLSEPARGQFFEELRAYLATVEPDIPFVVRS